MKIVALQVENIKKLVAVEIRPDGNLVQITGKNGQGKTSVLDSIWWALSGASHIQAAPIRKGATSARIRLDLGELKVTRTFRQSADGADATSAITVENEQGARFPSPQKMLDALLGELSFDPLEFARKDAKAQFEALRRFCPEVDFAAIANADKTDRDRRTEINRFAKQERAVAATILVPTDTPTDPVDESALVQQLEAAGRANAEREQRLANRQRLANEREQLALSAEAAKAEVEQLLRKAEQVREEVRKKFERAQQIEERIAAAGALPEKIDTSAISYRIEAARAVNENVRKADQRRAHETRASELEKQSETLTAQIDKRQAEKQAAIAAAKMPVDGLGFGDGVVLLNGLPFEQASDAEQLRASVAIAMALNPKLRVIRVRDGSLLDEDALQLLGRMCDEKDFQCWIEVVRSDGRMGFVLEDGQVHKAEAQPMEETSDAAA